VVLVAQAQNMAAATLAEGTPYRKAIDEARRVADKAADTQRQYNALDLRASMPSHETAPVDWDSEYTLFQVQSDFVWIENDLSKARSSIEGSIDELKDRRRELQRGMDERVQALALPVTSLVYAEAFLFASAGREINDRIDEAIASYQDADKAIEMQQRFAQAAAKTLEIRLRALRGSGRFSDIPDAELRGTPLSKFTMSR
jgi:signal transduction histidine kinase